MFGEIMAGPGCYGGVRRCYGGVMAVFGDVRRDYGGTWMTP